MQKKKDKKNHLKHKKKMLFDLCVAVSKMLAAADITKILKVQHHAEFAEGYSGQI